MGFIFIKVSGCALNLWESEDGCRHRHCVLKKKINKYNVLDIISVSQLSFYKEWKTVFTRIADTVCFILTFTPDYCRKTEMLMRKQTLFPMFLSLLVQEKLPRILRTSACSTVKYSV